MDIDDDARVSRAKEASFFIANFEALSQECRTNLKEQDKGSESSYTLKCPYTRRRQEEIFKEKKKSLNKK